MFLPLAEKMVLKMIDDGGLHTEAGTYNFLVYKFYNTEIFYQY